MENKETRTLQFFLALGVFVVAIVGALELRYYSNTIKPAYNADEKAYLLGTCDGKEVRVYSLDRNEPEKKEKGWIIEVDGSLVYMEIDKDKDGRPDQIAHFENGKRKYVSYRNSAGEHASRDVYCYEGDRLSQIIRDSNKEGLFLQRIRFQKDGSGVLEVRECGSFTTANTGNQ